MAYLIYASNGEGAYLRGDIAPALCEEHVPSTARAFCEDGHN